MKKGVALHFHTPDPTGLPYQIELYRSKSERVEFDISKLFNRNPSFNVGELFAYNNDFFASIDAKRTKRIFDLYAHAHDRLLNQLNVDQLHEEIASAIEALLTEIPFDEMCQFMRGYTIEYDRNRIKDDYASTPISRRFSHIRNFERQTYTRSAYLELIYLAAYLRFLAPIWGQYMRRIEDEHPYKSYREFVAFRLLSNAPVYESRPMEGLFAFVEENLRSTAGQSHQIGIQYLPYIRQGLSGSDIPVFLTAQAVFKALLQEPLSGPDNNLTVKIFRRVNQFGNKSRDGKGGSNSLPNIHPKSKNQFSGDDDDDGEKSHVEQFKVKESIPAGDLIAYSIFCEHPPRLLARLKGPDEAVEQTHAYQILGQLQLQAQQTQQFAPLPVQLTLIKWLVGTIIPPPIIENLSKKSLLNVLAVCQALLFEWRYDDFAAILLASPTRDPVDDQLVKRQITSDHFRYFEQLYPMYPSDAQGKSSQQRRQNMAWIGVEELANQLTRNEWVPLNDRSLLGGCRYLYDHQTHQLISFGGDFKVQIGQLVLDLIEQQRQILQKRQFLFTQTLAS